MHLQWQIVKGFQHFNKENGYFFEKSNSIVGFKMSVDKDICKSH